MIYNSKKSPKTANNKASNHNYVYEILLFFYYPNI